MLSFWVMAEGLCCLHIKHNRSTEMHSLGSCDGPELQEALVVMGEEFPAAVLEEKKKKTHKNATQNNPTCEQIFTIITFVALSICAACT